MYVLKIYRGVICHHDNEEWCKTWRGIESSVQNWHEEFYEFWPKHLKISKICTLIGYFSPKHIMFELNKYKKAMFDGTEDWCKIWRNTDLSFQKWQEEFGKFSPEHSKVSKLRLWWDPFIQSRKYMSLNFTGELCVMTMKNDAKFEEELTCRSSKLTRRTRKSQKICTLMGCFWPQYTMFELNEYRGAVWWHWRLMQNLKENWLVLSKMTWGIWQMVTGWSIDKNSKQPDGLDAV